MRPRRGQLRTANDPYVITVGAADDLGSKSIGDDTLASWSSRGVTQDGFEKPDLIAPGAHMVSTMAPAPSTRAYARPASRTPTTSGSAAPRWPPGVISGEAALLLQSDRA